MTLSALIRKRDTGNLATAIPAISATQPKGEAATVARIATVAVANPKEEKTAPPAKLGASGTAQPFDREAWEERAAICEHDGGLSADDAEAVAWLEDERRRCCHCLNLLVHGVCKVASPQGIVVANRGYRPVDTLRRCEGYRPCPDDPDQRPGRERWPGLMRR